MELISASLLTRHQTPRLRDSLVPTLANITSPDNENPTGSPHLPALTSHLRTLFSAHRQSKPYYLSAAPQCPRPDASIPVSLLLQDLDFVWPQFYHNPSCNLNAGQGFLNSLTAWSNDLENGRGSGFNDIGNGLTGTRLLVGAAAASDVGSGFVGVSEYKRILEGVKGLGLGNLGGGMWWDGSYLELNREGGGFARALREVLG